MKKVFIITEGGRDIGFGHVTRCISLYQAFEEKGILPNLIIKGDESVESIVHEKRYEIFDWLKDKERFFEVLEGADVAIVDSYMADQKTYKRLAKAVRVPVYIDDNKRLEYPDGVLVNGTVYADEIYPRQKGGMTYLLGTAYIPIRKDFWDVSKKRIREDVESLVITFGGDDFRNMTPKILRFLTERYPEIKKKVIIGGGFKNSGQIESVKDKKTELIWQSSGYQMRRVFASSDIAITAGGQTLYELARIGMPAIAIIVADNQINNVRGWQKVGFVENAGLWNDKELLSRLFESLECLRQKKHRFQRSAIGKRFVDGMGARRIRDILIDRCKRGARPANFIGFSLRPATVNDRDQILIWRNNPIARKNSFDNRVIARKEHKEWFNKKVDDPDVKIYIALLEDKKTGVIRFEARDDFIDVHVYLNPDFLGKGLGTELIRQGTTKLFNEMGRERPVIAQTTIGNVASQKAFSKAGYICMEKKTDRFFYEKKG